MDVTTVVKFAALILTGLFAALGSSYETKDRTTGKLTRWGKYTLYGAIISGTLSVLILVLETSGAISSARAATAAAQKTESTLANILQEAQGTLTELKTARSEAEKSATQLSQQQEIIYASTQALKLDVRNTSEESRARLSASIRSSGVEVSNRLRNTQDALNTSVNMAQASMSRSVTDAEGRIRGAVNQALNDTESKIAKAVEDAVENSGELITSSTQTAIEVQTRNIGEMAREAVADQIMRIPLVVEQDSERRLGGPLSDVLLKVGDISRNKPFKLTLKREGDTKPIWDDFITPDRKNKAARYSISFMHPQTKHEYQLEMFIQTQTNLLGSGLDYLIARVVAERRAGTR